MHKKYLYFPFHILDGLSVQTTTVLMQKRQEIKLSCRNHNLRYALVMYLFWSTTIFLDIINKYDLPSIKPDLQTLTYGCYTQTVPWFLTKADKGQGGLCLPSRIYILCSKNKMRLSRQLLLTQ